MKNALLILCIIIASQAVAQNIINQAAEQPTYDVNGDPLTNIMDPDGMRQGDWYFVDFNSNEIVWKEYQNNQCTSTYVKMNGTWIVTSDLNSDSQLEQTLNTQLINSAAPLSVDQQILVIIDDQNNVEQVIGLGNWNQQDFNEAKNIIVDYLNDNTPGYFQETYLLF